MDKTLTEFYSDLSDGQMSDLQEHLQKRVEHRKNKEDTFGVVFDMLHECNLRCKGCGTDADITLQQVINNPKPSYDEVVRVLEKLKQYSDTSGKKMFLNFGGGEPYLRGDIQEVLKYAAGLFGANGVAIDTNASLDESYDRIKASIPNLSNVGISINGLEDHHNWWSGNSGINSFQRATGVVGKLCMDPNIREKIEVTSVPTKKNLQDIPELMRFLADKGVQNYSVHRSMPVGRNKNQSHLIPSAQEYLKLLVDMIAVAKETGINTHLHHSIESIHAALLLGLNTYADKEGNPDLRSSIGIEPEGKIVFDPWCTTGVWKSLPSGNLITDRDLDLHDHLSEETGIFKLSKGFASPETRCDGCEVTCSGGSRVAAAANKLSRIDAGRINEAQVLDAMTAVDPACPLYEEGKSL